MVCLCIKHRADLDYEDIEEVLDSWVDEIETVGGEKSYIANMKIRTKVLWVMPATLKFTLFSGCKLKSKFEAEDLLSVRLREYNEYKLERVNSKIKSIRRV